MTKKASGWVLHNQQNTGTKKLSDFVDFCRLGEFDLRGTPLAADCAGDSRIVEHFSLKTK